MATRVKNSKVTKAFKPQFAMLKETIKGALSVAVEERGQELLVDLQEAATGTGRQVRKYSGAGSPGTGLDVPAPRLRPNMIGNISGSLRDNLKVAYSEKRGKVVSEVGFGKEFRSRGGAAANAIKWPQEEPFVSVQSAPEPGDQTITEAEDVTEYVPKVILGTKTILGRNILRLGLYDDIMSNKTLNLIKEKVSAALRSDSDEVPF